jgi:hypothetical protein
MKNPTHSFLLKSRITLPPMGAIGNVSKKALIRHIAKPVLPITVNPPIKRAKKAAAKAKEMRIEAEAKVTLRRSVTFGL